MSVKQRFVFLKKRKQIHDFNFVINGEKLEIVDSFTYLGIKFTHTGNLSQAVKALSEQALKAYCNLMYVFDRIQLDIKTKLSLFDAMVVPILTYGSEVWGIYDFKEVDKLHIKLCKHILGVKPQTPTNAVLGELGRFPLSIICKERSLKFWQKIMRNRNSHMFTTYTDQILNIRGNCWAKKIIQ